MGDAGAFLFTFQYGQIYYETKIYIKQPTRTIYIPIWLDLLLLMCSRRCYKKDLFTFQYGQIYYKREQIQLDITQDYLHSNMVRFIMKV